MPPKPIWRQPHPAEKHWMLIFHPAQARVQKMGIFIL
jgi:hypothetical protein